MKGNQFVNISRSLYEIATICKCETLHIPILKAVRIVENGRKCVYVCVIGSNCGAHERTSTLGKK